MLKINPRYVLLLVCVISGIFYISSSEYRDITANLFVAMIMVLVIEQIIKRSELKRKERSISYVKRRITSVYTDLIWLMGPPKNWEERIRRKDLNWDDYYHKVWNVKENALHTLETLLERYYDLIDAMELADDIHDMVGLLEDRIRWIMADPDTTLKRDPLSLHTISGDVVNIISESINTIKRHKLLHGPTSLLISYREGELPKMERRKVANVDRHLKRHYSFFKQFLDESIRFRDKNYDLFKKKVGKK